MIDNYDNIIQKAQTLVEALPYIRAYTNKYVVIKYGGNAMNSPEIIKTIMQDVAALKTVGVYPVVVHGGGPEINAMLSRVGKQSKFINGLRVTDEETMDIVQMVLCGKVNKNICSLLGSMGVRAVGLSGKDGGLIRVRKKPPAERYPKSRSSDCATVGGSAGLWRWCTPAGKRPRFGKNAHRAQADVVFLLGAEKDVVAKRTLRPRGSGG